MKRVSLFSNINDVQINSVLQWRFCRYTKRYFCIEQSSLESSGKLQSSVNRRLCYCWANRLAGLEALAFWCKLVCITSRWCCTWYVCISIDNIIHVFIWFSEAFIASRISVNNGTRLLLILFVSASTITLSQCLIKYLTRRAMISFTSAQRKLPLISFIP